MHSQIKFRKQGHSFLLISFVSHYEKVYIFLNIFFKCYIRKMEGMQAEYEKKSKHDRR